MSHPFEDANQLLLEGKTEDAFTAFLSIVTVSTQQLHRAKFTHQYLVNRTTEYQQSIDLIRKSTDQLEKILAHKPKPPVPPRPAKINTLNLKRAHGNSTSFVDDDDDEEDESVDIVAEFLTQTKKTNKSSQFITMGDVLLQTVIDSSNLAPAQTHTGDSLSIPTRSPAVGYIPNIPVPPLLTIHRQLQKQNNHPTLLPKIRSLYMSAMTIPTMMEFPAGLLAYQLTLIESALFRAISPEALLSHSGRSPHPRVVASTDFFNFLTRTIEHSILLPQEACRRAEILNRWIKVASKLLLLSNYQTLKAIVSALGTPPIQRLRRTWECIPKKQINRLDVLSALMSESDNYCQYRQHAQERNRPAVPFLGVFIHDITYLTAAHKELAPILDQMERFQLLPEYPQQPPPSFVIKRHLFRPTALHFSSKGTTSAAACMVSEEGQSEETLIGLEQQLIMQYVLMRPWVTEKTIDMLSQLREPPKRPASNSSLTSIRWEEEDKRTLSGFWPFRKSTTQPTVDWQLEEGEKKTTRKGQHHRSFSLPSKATIDITQ
ncbi:hypothetical protein CU098_012840 [Rhizopus stolonifer]|uniref:Ras-GEF domain-containing protein n=1 Tax=Rhizopus stolonifer TaxID=4846 RepID=A0A367KR48_RHIST|nr:hypothetical protein CU098_012840 [Rhizopus stolonifer]